MLRITRARGPFAALVKLLVPTGQRRNEVARLSAWLWKLPKARSKNGQPHDIPLSEPAYTPYEIRIVCTPLNTFLPPETIKRLEAGETLFADGVEPESFVIEPEPPAPVAEPIEPVEELPPARVMTVDPDVFSNIRLSGRRALGRRQFRIDQPAQFGLPVAKGLVGQPRSVFDRVQSAFPEPSMPAFSRRRLMASNP
jgi:hypothetical protein